MFSVSGLRGIVGTDLFPETIVQYAAHFGQFTGRGAVVIGRDTRGSGRSFRKAVIHGLRGVGCRVIDLGVVPTPTVVYMVRKLRARGGIAITASHNPSQWNALKFVSSRGQFLNKQEFRTFRRRTEGGAVDAADAKSVQEPDMLEVGAEQHIDAVIRALNIQTAGLRVGVDAVNGAGSVALPQLLERMGCRVHTVHCDPSPTFPRPPEPVPAHLSVLCRLVRDRNLDIGFACDPDADRLACIDEKARPIGEEKTLVLAADYVSRRTKRPIVTNLSTTALIDHIAKNHGVPVLRTPVGEAHVVSKMIQTGAAIGGEGNGGIIYPRINFTRDSLVAAALVVKMMTSRGKTLSEICASYPAYVMIKMTLPVSRVQFDRQKKKLSRVMKGRVNRRDGLKITAKECWIHIRPSQTEPLVRIIGEARDAKTLRRCILTIKKILRKP